jgi:hypothetical protein
MSAVRNAAATPGAATTAEPARLCRVDVPATIRAGYLYGPGPLSRNLLAATPSRETAAVRASAP